MRGRPVHLALFFACLAVLGWAAPARAATLVSIGDFDAPIYVTSDPADADRLLVAERAGRVLLVEGSGSAVLADLTALVQCCEPSGKFQGERGLLSIAPAPNFATNGRFFAAYTGKEATAGGATGDIHLDAFRPGPGGGLIREPILTIPHSTRANHNGGQLQLGPDGYLYLATGDGGGVGDPDDNAQDIDSLLGKVLRIDPRPGATPAYVVPPDNPFVGTAGADEIWAYGLRNPWRFSFDRLSGRMVIGDVGQGRREEVDLGMVGANYGWDCREGFVAYTGPGAPVSCPGSGFTDPVFDYPHADPGGGAAFGCSIVGGYVARDPSVPELFGRYLYADFCEGELRSLVLPSGLGGAASEDRSEDLSVTGPVSFGEDSAGRVYVVSNEGPVYRLVGPSASPDGSVPPPATEPPRLRPLVLLNARRGRGHLVKLIVRLLPCEVEPGATVHVNRNGRPFRQRRVNHGCVARFRVRVGRRPVRFRAFFEDQRSQVRKIAFAKPRP